MWHVHQPIYWNDQNRSGSVDRYEYAHESMQNKGGSTWNGYPQNDLDQIFGLDDRKAAYQYRMKDSLGTIGSHANSGVAVSYSGALMENVGSLGFAGWNGYSNDWWRPIKDANTWTTTLGKPRLDIVNFAYHHSLSGLHNPETNYMEIRLHQEKVKAIFGQSAVSKGFFPTEMTFSTRLIPTLKQLGINWSIASGEHIARACPDFPIVFGSGGINCAPPNRADQINPNGVEFLREQIDRGYSPANANPLSYQPAYAKYVDPETGTEHKIIVVPADQTMGWKDGYACLNGGFIDQLEARNDPSQPSLVLMAHDGDNAFGGGFSYYNECVPGQANDVRNKGGEVTSVETYLAQFPPSTSKTIHVEDGGWGYADGDFGSPTYINWNYPLLNAQGQHDPANGWHEKAREMAIFTETLNRVLTAQKIKNVQEGYNPNFLKIMTPDGSTHPVDRAWHYYLGALDSGNVYYGTPLDLEIKGTIGCNEAFEHVDPILTSALGSTPALDTVPPTVWLPQRFPYNPGSVNYGVEHQYKQYIDDGDFHIWTFIGEVSGPATAVLKYRIDGDGQNPLTSNQNETFVGGGEVGTWQSLPMNGRDFPAANIYNKGGLDYVELPQHIARHYSVEVVGLRDKLIDYYVEATDARGNVAKSPIQHVYIGTGEGSGGGGGGSTVVLDPAPPVRGQNVTVTYDPTGRNLAGAPTVKIHYGFNNWQAGTVVTPDPSMTLANNKWTFTLLVPETATQLDIVFNNGAGVWDNNGGADWHFTTSVSGGSPPTAAFTATPLSGVAPLQVQFTDTSVGVPTGWEWDFNNDGTIDSSVRNPSHTYTVPGSYSVSLKASNSADNDTELKTDYITVTAPPTDPAITVSKQTISASALAGTDAAADSFTVTNTGAGTLSYTITTDASAAADVIEDLHYYLLGYHNDATGLDVNEDGQVNVADLVRAMNGGASVTWLVVSPTNGTSTGESDTINVTYDTDALAPGIYNATITVAGNAANSPRTIDVTLTISAITPVISLNKTSITGTATVGTSPANDSFTATNSGNGTLNWGAQPISTGQGIDWLSVNPTSGNSTGEADTVAVTFNTASKAVGTYAAKIEVTGNSANSPRLIDVSVNITEQTPGSTTVVPNPPQAGQGARVWYKATGGPIANATAITLHWGINGGMTAGAATWQNVTDTAMLQSATAGMWYLDITVPANATTLNFVTNNGGGTWDNNSNQDWNFAVAQGNPQIALNVTSLGASAAQGAQPADQSFTVTNSGTGTLNWSAAFTDTTTRSARTIGNRGAGSRKTITIDGVNTQGEWTNAELVATDPAFDNANVAGTNWSTHETQFDYTGLYAAWDATHLYVAFQIADVIDVEDPANAGSSNGTRPHQMNLIQYIALDTRSGGYGSSPTTGDMWGKGHGFAGDDKPDFQVYFASNFWQGPFLREWLGTAWAGDAGQVGPTPTGLKGLSANHWAGGPIIGSGGKNYVTQGHNTGRNSFFEVRIPLSLIGNPNLDNTSLGLWVSHGEGNLFSGVDSIPNDPATTNTPGVTNSNSPKEWEDFDVYNQPFAKVGLGEGGGTSPWLSLSPTTGSSTGEADSVSVTYSTVGLVPGTYTGRIDVTGNAANSPRAIDVTLNVTGGADAPLIQLNKSTISGTVSQGNSPAATSFTVTNSGTGTLNWSAAKADTGQGTTWFTIAPVSGISTGEADTVDVTFSTAALTPGTYAARIDVTGNATNSPRQIAVTVTVTASPADPAITLNKTAISASAAVGGAPSNDSFTVTNSGGGTLNWTAAKTDTGEGTAWFSLSPTSGSSTGEADSVTVSFNTAGLTAGTYDAEISVTGNAANSPRTIAVSLTITGGSDPTTTTVVPNPPTAGQNARVWYKASGGPLAAAPSINLHWGINGGAQGGGTWVSVTSTVMTLSPTAGMWYADITLPANATSLNFVTNTGGTTWDNNSNANWNFAVNAGPPTPLIGLSRNTISTSTTVGNNPSNETFTVSNSGTGTLSYNVTPFDTGSGLAWLQVSPTSGSSTGEADTITVSFLASGLAAGTYGARIDVTGSTSNSPQSVNVSLTVSSQPTLPTITIGAGPTIGSNTEGISYKQEFQDWVADDVRGLDTNDATTLGDGYDGSRDIVAFYSRFQGDNLYLRVDLLELGIFAENGNVDVYVLIDCANGGTNNLPDGLSGGTWSRQWDVAVCTYDATNGAVRNSAGTAIATAHLGAYWRSDLDAVEFGVKKSALTGVGWDGTSPIYFTVVTAKDLSGQMADSINLAGAAMSSTGTSGRAKFAVVAHGNQSLNRGDGMRDRIYKSAATTGVGAPSGFRLTLDTHSIFQIALNIHMSATLISAIGWIEDANPIWDGGAFLETVGDIIDANQTSHPGAKIGGVFSEHIMPFFNGGVNRNSIDHFDALTADLWSITGSDMKVMHIPERVTNSVASPGADPFDDIVASAYSATYIDEIAHIRDWLYPGDAWTGIGGAYGIPRQHKILKINGVYCFLINDNEDQYKFWPQDGGANMNWRLNLLYKALDTDQQQLTLIFDDWEAMAGYSFGSGYNNNAVQYNDVMRWVANHPWIEVVTLKDIYERATNTSHPQYSAGWIVDQGDIGNKTFNTYDYLHHATEDSYTNWYYGSAQEESFRNAVPVVTGVVGNGQALPSGKVFGDLATPGTIIRDTWDAVQAAPQNNLRKVAEKAYQAMIYETAWHDEDNTNYERRADQNYHGWSSPDTTYDKVSGWAYTLHNHVRGVTITTAAAQWVASIKNGTRPAGVSVQSLDLDQDGQNEYVISNEKLWFAFEARGGRCVQAYYYDSGIQDGYSILGTSPINNPSSQGEEEGTANASRCSAFKEVNGNAYADVVYTVATGASSITFTSPNGQVVKTFTLAQGSSVLTVSYNNTTGGDLYTRLGVGVNNLDLLHRGRNFASSYTATTFTQQNNTRGKLVLTCGSGAGVNQLDAFTRYVIPLTEQMEVRLGTGSSSFTIDVTQGP